MKDSGIVDQYFDAWNEHSPDLIVACFASGGIYIDPNVPDGVEGRQIGEFANGLFQALTDLHLDVVSRDSLDDGRVVVEWLLHAKPGIKLLGVDFIKLNGDKIASVRGYYDRLTLDRQLNRKST